MKHGKKKRKFGRMRDQRRALLRGLAVNLILKEKITTTEAKAKELRPYIEKLITKARKKDLANLRNLKARLGLVASKKLITVIGPRYIARKGGYSRIIKKGIRLHDNAKMAIIELIK